MISTERLRNLISQPRETSGLEFKEAKTSYDREKLFKYVVAIANERGGFIVFGVSDVPPRTIVGTSVFPNLEQITSQIRQNTGLNVEVSQMRLDDKRVLALRIPSRPAGTCYQYRGAYWMRSGEELVAMTEDRLRSIFSEGRLEWGMQPLVSGVSAAEVFELLDVGSFLSIWGHPEGGSDDEKIGRLVDARLIEGNGSAYILTNMAGLLLSNDLSIFPPLERKAPRLIIYNGNDKLDTRKDIVGRRGYAVGFSGLVRSAMDSMPQNEVLENALRTTAPLFPERPLRELVANALIHQDLEVSGTSPIIEIYQNRIEISNPGLPVVPVERFIDGHRSRNERLTWVMRQLKICEERSSGIDRVVSAAEMYQLPAPEFIAEFESTKAIVHGHRSFEAMTQDDKTRACYQHAVLKYVMREPMTNDTLRERFGSGPDTSAVSRIIKATVDSGMIIPDPAVGKSRKFARYLPYFAQEGS
ncbi:MAG: ATP-binding protein [Jannaschia helgolandensis]|uniref:ATP-dependent DNA helicase RecG n=1 Tax=Jannaschia helgolandensis TaxID=188906 RepID=A0A1H7FDX5_9RHOB|nr:ATP-binding protein [Jannaschia helgolandensis]SEK22280.1 ATP-dependent DNA helicase RecG [Jannaschia helgolandensis]